MVFISFSFSLSPFPHASQGARLKRSQVRGKVNRLSNKNTQKRYSLICLSTARKLCLVSSLAGVSVKATYGRFSNGSLAM